MPGEGNRGRNRSREQEERKTVNSMDRQHHPVDGIISTGSDDLLISTHIGGDWFMMLLIL